MIINSLKLTYETNKEKNLLFVRNLLKEKLQYFVLNFIYNSSYGKDFLFKGGTCLRFCFNLPRLSEDLDFDVGNYRQFSFQKFTDDLEKYFISKLKYKDLKIRISGRNKIIYLQFPVLKRIGIPIDKTKDSENVLFVRIDLSPIKGRFFKEMLSLQSTDNFSFLIKHYSLPDLFAGKIAAILQRETWEGQVKIPRFKGRDFFDYFWLKQKGVKPNYKYLSSLISEDSKKAIENQIKKKIEKASQRRKELERDLQPFFIEQSFVKNFIQNLEKLS